MATFLTNEELAALNEQILNGGAEVATAARMKLVMAFQPYIEHTAKRWARSLGIPRSQWPDVIGECQVVALQAVQKFDPLRSPSFVAMLPFGLQHAVEDYSARMLFAVKYPGGIFRAAHTFSATAEKIRKAGEEPTTDKVMAESRLSINEAEYFRRPENLPRFPISMDVPLSAGNGEQGQTLADILPAPEISPIRAVCVQNARSVLSAALQGLSPREERIVRARRFVAEGDDVSLEVLGEEYGVSRERIRQIEERALEKLRDHMKKKRMTYEALSLVE